MQHDWVTGPEAWDHFRKAHPELGYQAGKWAFHNFLRRHRQVLVDADVIRFAKGRFWIARQTLFADTAFDCATGKQ